MDATITDNLKACELVFEVLTRVLPKDKLWQHIIHGLRCAMECKAKVGLVGGMHVDERHELRRALLVVAKTQGAQ